MFERTIEEVKAGKIVIWVDNKQASFVGEFATIAPGWLHLDWDESMELQRLCRKFFALAPKRHRKAIQTVHNSITLSWGPELDLTFI